MIKKIIATLIACTGMVAVISPSQAEAVKLKVEPSVTFRNSYEHTRVRQPRSRRMVRQRYVPQREVVYVYPEDDYYYYEDEYYVPRHYRTRTSGTDFGLTFKLK